MRLVECHIENFGRLHDFDMSFEGGCNATRGQNGWGKSTLAAFILVMLYGFEGESKRSIHENERKRWNPWQGGVYGGRLTFEEGEKRYTIYRTFAAKALDDTFELYDASTGLVSEDYSQNIGEELFGVNRASFERTAFIGQSDVITETTDGINSKIGNIADSSNDLDCFEKAYSKLTDLINKNSPTRATGYLSKLKAEVTTLRTQVRDGSVILDSMHRQQDNILAKQSILEGKIAKRDEIRAKQKIISEYKDVQAIKDIYKKISDDCDERMKSKEESRTLFPGELPVEEDILKMLERSSDAAKLSSKLDVYTMTSDEHTRKDRLTKKYEDNPTTLEETSLLLREWRNRESRMMTETAKQADLKVMRGELDAEKRELRRLPSLAVAGMIIIVVAMALAIASVAILPSVKLIAIGLVVAAIVLTIGVVLTIITLRRHRDELDGFIVSTTDNLEKLEKELTDDIRARNDVDAMVTTFLNKYGIAFSESNVVSDIEKIQDEIDELNELSEKQKGYMDTLDTQNNMKKEVEEYIKSLKMVPQENMQMQLNKMLVDLKSYNEASKIAESAAKQRADYEKEHDIENIMNKSLPEDMPELAVLNEEVSELNVEIDRLNADLRELNSQLDGLSEKYEAWEESREKLAAKEQEEFDGTRSYKRMVKAKDYLAIAKESLTSRYMGPLMDGFVKYYSMITGESGSNYKIDANIGINVEELGAIRDTKLLSAGYQDLIGFCMRMALIDAMYDSQKPVVVLDDPFVNLDREKRKRAEDMLENISAEYQLIYFTCN